jgi:phage gp29-like protein
MEVTGLVDQYGRPLKVTAVAKRDLAEEQSAPTMTGVRSIWHEGVASGLTPQKLARIMRDSAEPGADLTDYLTLAEEMEEREPQYRMALGQRKLAIRNIKPVVTAASEEPEDEELAADVLKLVDNTGFRNIIMHLADGIAKGFAVAETVWSMSGIAWHPSRILPRDQRHFQFDRLTGREVRLREDGNPDGLGLTPGKYIIHTPVLKSGTPIRQGLARTAMWIFMLKSFSLKDWMAFLEVYGMPFRVGKYGPGATEGDKRALLRAVANVAADGGAIIPESMILEFIETKASAGGENAFKGMASYLDEQFAKLIIGQTMTSADGSSKSQAEVHDDIRLLILRADGDDLAATVQRDLVNPYITFNKGVPKNGFPQVTFPVDDPEDLKLLMEATDKFIGMGGEVPMAPVLAKLGWREPKAGEKVLKRAPAPVAPPASGAVADQLRRLRERDTLALSLLEDPLTGLAAELVSEWEVQMDPLLKAVQTALQGALTFADFQQRLGELTGSADLQPLIDRLTAATFVARIEGNENDGR